MAGLEGAALAVLTALGGTPWWLALRVLVVAVLTAAVAWLLHRPGRAGPGAAALGWGITGMVAGAGIGSAHLAKAGTGLAVVMAAVALVTGVILAGWGITALTRALPGWWRLLAVPAVLAIFEFVLFPLTGAVNATNRPPGGLGPGTPAASGLAYRDVTLRTSDGVRLSAWYVPSHNGAGVVLLPGAGSARTSLLGQAAALARRGYGALLLDTRGHGRSGGHAMDFGWYGNADISAAVTWLQRQPDVAPGKIALLGLSMGGEQAIVAAGPDPRVRAVVAEGVTGEQPADHGWRPHDIDGIIQRGMDWVEYTGASLMTGAPRPMPLRDALRAAAPRPVLIIAGGNVPGEPAAARWFQAASPATVRVWVVPGAGHTGGLAAQPRQWDTRVASFLDAALSAQH
jgi:uncharacterized protein